jgi:hypothetical protein
MEIDGDLDGTAGRIILRRVRVLRTEGCPRIELDLSAVRRVEPDAIPRIVEAHEELRAARGHLAIVEAPTPLSQRLAALGLQFLLG